MDFGQTPTISIFIMIFETFCEDRKTHQLYGNIIFISIDAKVIAQKVIFFSVAGKNLFAQKKS